MTSDKKEEKDYYGVAPISSIIKKIKRDYDKNPKDWRVIGSSDERGNTDTFITKKPNAYWLKSKQLSPYSALSMGTVVRNLDRDIDERIGKNMSPNDMLRLFGMIVPIKRDQNIIASGIEKYSQEHGNHLKELINERDPNIEHVLGRRIDKEFTKRHPQRRGLYI
ncbi:MAG: hypothetical protein KAV01_12700 [Candidatus Lokiarchaeota archaeon]|nr:hypothetical protein [Candidatus Lokiarchaeota archaeon]MCK4481380.1 hypothetical protein [Candidatus Lokiarchaeota archaeon]